MAYPNVGASEEHADHVETIRLRLPPVPVDPDHRGTLQLLALSMVHCLDGPAEFGPSPGFHLDEGDDPIPLYNQIDVAVTAAKASLDDAPSAPTQPPLRYSFSELAKRLPGR